NTNINVRGNIAGLPDANKVSGNLVINNISTSRKDIQLLMPKGTLPANITLPETMKLTGSIAGNMNAAKANLNLATNLGGASVNGSISNPTDKKRAKYDGTITARQLDLGVIMQNDSMYGPLTASVTASGTGFDPKTMNARLNGTVTSAVYNKYNYKNLNFTGEMIAQKGKLKMDIKDPNITIALDADADLSGKFPAIKLNTTIDTVNVTALHFTSDTLTYKGNITADFPNTDPADLTGNLFIAGSRIIMGSQHYSLDTISLRSGKSDTGEFLVLNSQGINAALTGKYNLAQLGSVFQQTIQPYYALDSIGNKDTLDDYNFNFTAQITKSPLFTVFLPSLNRMDPIKMNAHFATDEGFNAVVDAP
ncbi:MAG: hypothetical protein J7497_17840, partial [Chitinophagaceae bacterium]|nr:hypothetical protein [Chitinophagaceae bacterium]